MSLWIQLQKDWQAQLVKVQQVKVEEREFPALLQRIRMTEKREHLIDLAKTIVVLSSMVTMVWLILMRFGQAPLVIIGIMWIALTTFVFLLNYWRVHRVSALAPLESPTLEFVGGMTAQIGRLQLLHRLSVPLFIVSFTLGVNILFRELSANQRSVSPVIFHLGLTILLFTAGLLGLAVRKRRFRRKWQPLLDELLSMKHDLEQQ